MQSWCPDRLPFLLVRGGSFFLFYYSAKSCLRRTSTAMSPMLPLLAMLAWLLRGPTLVCIPGIDLPYQVPGSCQPRLALFPKDPPQSTVHSHSIDSSTFDCIHSPLGQIFMRLQTPYQWRVPTVCNTWYDCPCPSGWCSARQTVVQTVFPVVIVCVYIWS